MPPPSRGRKNRAGLRDIMKSPHTPPNSPPATGPLMHAKKGLKSKKNSSLFRSPCSGRHARGEERCVTTLINAAKETRKTGDICRLFENKLVTGK